MADETMWDRVRKELATPWDWVAAGVGAAGGLGVSIAMGGTDGGTAAAIGALAAVSARKAGAAGWRGRTLGRRAHGLLRLLQRKIETTLSPADQQFRDAVHALRRDLELWEDRVISHDQFDSLLNQHTENYRKLV